MVCCCCCCCCCSWRFLVLPRIGVKSSVLFLVVETTKFGSMKFGFSLTESSFKSSFAALVFYGFPLSHSFLFNQPNNYFCWAFFPGKWFLCYFLSLCPIFTNIFRIHCLFRYSNLFIVCVFIPIFLFKFMSSFLLCFLDHYYKF